VAKVYISEYDVMPVLSGNAVPTGQEPAVAEQPVAITAGSVQSTAFAANTKFVRVHTDAICSYSFGANPTATVNTPRLAANATEFFGVRGGHKIAIITNT
jgi:hypothetical protein